MTDQYDDVDETNYTMTDQPAPPTASISPTDIEVVFLDPDRPHISPDERGCPDCGQDAYYSGCEADGCTGYGCQDCGTGCDLDFVDAVHGGRCAVDDEDEDED